MANLKQLSPECSGWWHTWIWRFSWGSSRCNIWRTILAFTFIAAMMWLLNALLGMYRTYKDHKDGGVSQGGEQSSGGYVIPQHHSPMPTYTTLSHVHPDIPLPPSCLVPLLLCTGENSWLIVM
ncbi:hypothetical protein IMZ48_14760 [Candidatus Bathyarchaeota archaeon]|nr:hypothetical protein [Candidatus Bathyarchaeota archaeon]